MAKGKHKSGGLSGISRFVLESMGANPAGNVVPTPKTSNEGTMANAGNFEQGAAKPPAKKRKKNDGTVVDTSYALSPSNFIPEEGCTSAWIEKYDATGVVPHYTHADQVPERLQKYFNQRYRFFSLYSTPPGCLLDEEGWYSVTPELVADQIAERCRCDTILDAFCGVGGNAIAFAKTCQRVIALDTSPTRLALARHNAQIYGVSDRIEFILADYISFAKSYLSLPKTSRERHDCLAGETERRKIDVVFLSPPWGGPSYLSGNVAPGPESSLAESLVPPTPTPDHASYSLSSIQPIHGTLLFDLTRGITKNIAYYLPRNTKLDEISALLSEEKARTVAASARADSSSDGRPSTSAREERVEVEEEWMGNKLKALTCYFGGLAQGQEELF